MHNPTSPSERLAFLDLLRGFALFGVIVANMATHSGFFFLSESQAASFATAKIDGAVSWIIHFLIEGKFYSLFAMLFGIGFAIQLKRAAQKQIHFTGLYSRRLVVLFLIGLLHAVFFYVGDILTVYAITGFVLLLFRNTSDKLVLRSAFTLLLLPVIQYSFLWWGGVFPETPDAPQNSAETQRAFFDSLVATYRNGSYLDVIRNNIGGLIFGRYPDLIFTGRFFRVLAMFLIGFYVTRNINLRDLESHRPMLRKTLVITACIGFPCNLLLAILMETNVYYGLRPLGLLQPLAYAYGVPALCLFYASGLALLYQKESWQRILLLFAPVGQLALTNYLMQSVLCCFVFMNYGFGMFGTIGPAYLSLIALIIFASQVVFSHWWVKRFRFGPAEWLWRSITYRKWQSLRKESSRPFVSEGA